MDQTLYRVGDELGRGTYGRVYRCVRLSDGRVSRLCMDHTSLKYLHAHNKPMACKVQRSQTSYEKWATNREVDVWRTAAHASRYVVQLYDASYNMDTREVRMYTELCEGGDTYRMLERICHCEAEPRIHPLIIYHVALQIAWGLADIQAKNILHRDLKTDNVLMTIKITAEMNQGLWSLTQNSILPEEYSKDFNALCDKLYENNERLCVLTDFGLSRDETNNERSTYTVGPGARWTIGTSAPELQFYNVQSSMADIYSAGVLVWTLCTRMGPPNAGTAFARLPKYYDAGLQELIDECLEWSDPTKRPTAGNMVKRLNRLKLAEAGRINEALKKDKTMKFQRQNAQYLAEQARQVELELLAAQRDLDAAASRLAEAKAWKANIAARARADQAPAQVPGRISAFTKEQRKAHLANGPGNAAAAPAPVRPVVALRADRPAPPPPRNDDNARKQLENQQRLKLAEEQQRQKDAERKAAAAVEEQRRRKQKEQEEADRRAAEDQLRRQEAENERLRQEAKAAEEQRRRKQKEKEEADRRAAEDQLRRQEAEKQRRRQEAAAAAAAEEERRRKQKEREEADKRAAEDQLRRQEAEKQRRRQEAAAAAAAEEQRRRKQKEKEEADRRAAEDERRRQEAEKERLRQEAKAAAAAEEQRRRKQKEKEEADRRAAEDEWRRQEAEKQRRRQEAAAAAAADEQRRLKKKDKDQEEADRRAAGGQRRQHEIDREQAMRADQQRRRQEVDQRAQDQDEAKRRKKEKEEQHELAMILAIQNAGPKPPKPRPAKLPAKQPPRQPVEQYDPAREEQLRPKKDIRDERTRLPPSPPPPAPRRVRQQDPPGDELLRPQPDNGELRARMPNLPAQPMPQPGGYPRR